MPNIIRNVEIFSSGTWNGHEITDQDLDLMVDAFNKTSAKVRPHLKLGHKEQKILQADGLPAAGWIANLRKRGSKLIADFTDVPNKIFELINKKAYRKVSAEVFSNLEILGEKFPRMLGAVALLGADTPGVMNLDDILAWYTNQECYESVDFTNELKLDTITKEFEFMEDSSMPDNKKEDSKLKTLQQENEDLKAKLSKQQEDFSSISERLDLLETQNKEQSQQIIEAHQREKEAKIKHFVSDMSASNLISPAMAPFVEEFFSDKQEFSVDDKKFDKQGLFKEILTQSLEFAKLSFEPSTENIGGQKEDEFSKVKNFAKENNIDFDKDPSGAYRAYSQSKREA
jgi:hypothetical protein